MELCQKKERFEENQDTSNFEDTISTNIIKQKRYAKKSKVGKLQNEKVAKIKLHLNEISFKIL